MWDTYITGLSEGNESGKEAERTFEEVIAENLSKFDDR